jgi:hypothetical protein
MSMPGPKSPFQFLLSFLFLFALGSEFMRPLANILHMIYLCGLSVSLCM